MKKVVLDTNVLLSALLFRGPTSKIHTLWIKSEIFPVANKAMMQEYARSFTYDKFKLTSNEIAAIFDEEIFPYFSIIKSSTKRLLHLPDDPDDIPFIRSAVDGNADVLISGDSHLLALDGKYSFPIITPAVFLRGLP